MNMRCCLYFPTYSLFLKFSSLFLFRWLIIKELSLKFGHHFLRLRWIYSTVAYIKANVRSGKIKMLEPAGFLICIFVNTFWFLRIEIRNTLQCK